MGAINAIAAEWNLRKYLKAEAQLKAIIADRNAGPSVPRVSKKVD